MALLQKKQEKKVKLMNCRNCQKPIDNELIKSTLGARLLSFGFCTEQCMKNKMSEATLNLILYREYDITKIEDKAILELRSNEGKLLLKLQIPYEELGKLLIGNHQAQAQIIIETTYLQNLRKPA